MVLGDQTSGSRPAKGKRSQHKPTRLERLKRQVAKELGLWPKVRQAGWGGLTAAESGRVGGIMMHRLRQRRRLVKE